MCVVRVSMRKGRSPAQIAILSQVIDDALVESYGMARGDTFQVFEQLNDHALVFDRAYKAGPRPRSNDFLMMSIVGGPTPPEVKRAFYKRLVDLLGERAQVRPEDVFVGIQDAPATNWSFGMGQALA